jgi:flagellin-like hook-associated protein FlgL
LLSINANPGATSALQILQGIGRVISDLQTQLATGLAVSSPKDNPSTFAIATDVKDKVSSFGVLNQSRDRELSLLDTTLNAAQSISDQLTRMKSLALAASDPGLTAADRAKYATEFQSLSQQIDLAVQTSNFNGRNLIDQSGTDLLRYGPGVIAGPAVQWGDPPQAAGKPVSGEPLTLHFGFTGVGLPEQIDGQVDYKLSYQMGGTTTVVPLATATIPTSPPPTVGGGNPVYDAVATTTVPDIPQGATGVQIYAEYNKATYQVPDGDGINEVNGAPDQSPADDGHPQLLASWTEPQWSHNNYSAQDIGFSAIGDPNLTSQPTEAGQTINGSMDTGAIEPGINQLGADYTVYYQVQNGATWQTLASYSGSIPAGSQPPGGTSLPYSITIPDPPAGSEGFTAAKLVADVTVHHDGSAIPAAPTSVQPDSTVTAGGAVLGDPNETFLRNSDNKAQVTDNLTISATDPPGYSGYTAQADYSVRWFDGSSWHQTLLGTQNVGATNSASYLPFLGQLPVLPAGTQQAQIIADVQVNHLPVAPNTTPDVEQHTLVVSNWDGVTMTDHNAQLTVGYETNSSREYTEIRQRQTGVYLSTLDQTNGTQTTVRRTDLTSQGLMLDLTSLGSAASAQQAVGYVDAALTRVNQASEYYADRSTYFTGEKSLGTTMMDQLNGAVGQLVDADLAADGARLQAAQTRQSLVTQSLNMANAYPRMLLSLFR